MLNNEIGRELRNESIACRPYSPYLVDNSLWELLDFFAAHLKIMFVLIPSKSGIRKKERTKQSYMYRQQVME